MGEQQTVIHPPGNGYGGPPPPFGPPPGHFGPPSQPPAGLGPQPMPPYPPPPRRRTGLIIAAVAAGLVVVAGLALGALVLFGTKTIERSSVESEIVRLTQEQAGVAPTDVRCPDDIEAAAGGTFSCTATLDGQPITYSVRQQDDQGNLYIDSADFIVISRAEESVSEHVLQVVPDVEVTANCADGRQIIVGGAGTEITCRVTNAADETDFVDVTGTVAEDGSFTWDL
jgi:Domain of unknown function (DUF4333)